MPLRRVIPSLLLAGEGLVKTTRFGRPSYVGDPINVVRIFNEKEVDEVVLFDILASREGRPPRLDLIQQIVSEAFMPVCYGGAVRSVADARALLAVGIEKVAVNTAVLQNVRLAFDLASQFGSQCVVGVVDIRRDVLGRARVHSHTGGPVPERDPLRWAETLQQAGVGEIIVQSVDRDGTQSGLDGEIAASFAGRLDVPVVLGGGARDAADITRAFQMGRLSGVAVGAKFVWYGPHRAVLVTYLSPDEIRQVEEGAR